MGGAGRLFQNSFIKTKPITKYQYLVFGRKVASVNRQFCAARAQRVTNNKKAFFCCFSPSRDVRFPPVRFPAFALAHRESACKDS